MLSPILYRNSTFQATDPERVKMEKVQITVMDGSIVNGVPGRNLAITSKHPSDGGGYTRLVRLDSAVHRHPSTNLHEVSPRCQTSGPT